MYVDYPFSLSINVKTRTIFIAKRLNSHTLTEHRLAWLQEDQTEAEKPQGHVKRKGKCAFH